ncbi:hypothetical protein [Actinokineospora sp. HUAS TT18]|uniref:hypothetical protein n=1 Tax=Actinokineospora sp. HUAS TT18 TaxID=3447451 RepID=UPI003F525A65
MPEPTADVVRAPFTDRPALSDPTTAILLKPKQRAHHLMLVTSLFLGLILALQLLVLAMSDDPVRTFFTSTVWSAITVAGMVAQYAMVRPVPAVVALLGAQAWRPVGARVVRGTSTWLERSVVEVDGKLLRLTGASPAHLAVLARSGMVWLVGPDARGRAAVRIEGSHEAWLAQVVGGPVEPARLPDVGADVTAGWTTWLRGRTRLALVALALMAVGMLVALVILTESAWWQALVIVATVGAIAGAVAWRLSPLRANAGLAALLSAGVWVQVSASLAPWQARLGGFAKATATLRLADGRVLVAEMAAAPVDLLGTVWDTGALWVVGEPVPGATVAVGYPGYPLVTAAVING